MIADATMASNLSVVSLPYLRGSLQVGLAKLHRVLSVRKGGSIQVPQEVAIVCPHREVEGMQRDAVDQVLQAVKFKDKNAPGLNLELDEEFQAANCFSELIREPRG